MNKSEKAAPSIPFPFPPAISAGTVGHAETQQQIKTSRPIPASHQTLEFNLTHTDVGVVTLGGSQGSLTEQLVTAVRGLPSYLRLNLKRIP